MSKPFVVECTWSGYLSAGKTICHRQEISPKQAAALEKVHAISFTDGTLMKVEVRRRAFRERVKEINGYRSALESCWIQGRTGTVSIMEL